MNQKTKAQNKIVAKNCSISWTAKAWEQYLYWQKHDQAIVEEINNLLRECIRDPFKGTGKPEPLKGNLSAFWSRRINKEHRLVYLPEDGAIYVVQCRFHY